MIDSKSFEKMLVDGRDANFPIIADNEHTFFPRRTKIEFVRFIKHIFSLVGICDAKNFMDNYCLGYIASGTDVDRIVQAAIEKGWVIDNGDDQLRKEILFVLDNYEKFAYASPIDALSGYLDRVKNKKRY